MPTLFSSEYLLTHEVIEKTFKDKEEAKKFKKELKNKGYKVKMESYEVEAIYVVVGIKERE